MSKRTQRLRCPHCGSVFFTDKWNKKFCNDECRLGYRRKK